MPAFTIYAVELPSALGDRDFSGLFLNNESSQIRNTYAFTKPSNQKGDNSVCKVTLSSAHLMIKDHYL